MALSRSVGSRPSGRAQLVSLTRVYPMKTNDRPWPVPGSLQSLALRRWSCFGLGLVTAIAAHGQVASKPANASPVQSNVVTLSEFHVESTAERGYRADSSVSASRIKLPIQQTPVFLQVLTRDLIEDTGSMNVMDLTRYASGVNSSGEVGTIGERFTARGFGAFLIRNGFSQGNEGYITDATTIERLEIAKGPSGVIYGQSTPGGVLNVLSRRPNFDGRTAGSFGVKAGQYDYYRTEMDLRGPLALRTDTALAMAYRLVSSYTSNEWDLPYLERERFVIMPSFAAKLGDRAYLNVEYEMIKEKGKNAGSAPFKTVSDAFGSTTILDDTYNGRGLDAIGLIAGPDTYNDQAQYVLMGDLSVVLTESLNLRASYSTRNRDVESVDPIRNNNSYFFNNIRTLNYQERDEGSEGWKLDVLYRYGFESFRGSLVAGYEAQSITKKTLQNQKRNFAPLPPYSIGNPKTPQIPGDYLPGNDTSTALDSGAFFVINTLTFFNDRAHLVSGYRNEKAEIYNLIISRTASTDTREPTYQLGVAFDLTTHLTAFANRSTSFLPTASVDIAGKTLPPEVGEGFDFGFKASFWDGRLSGTLSYFDLERTNISRFVQINQPNGIIVLTNIPSGTERSKGVDFELNYSPTRQIDIVASATFFEGEVVSDQSEPRNNGRPIPLAAESSYALWGKYRFADKWAAALGYAYKSKIDNIDPLFARRLWVVPEYHQLDALIERQVRAFNQDLVVTLSVTNLTDRRTRANRFEHQDPRWVKLGVKTRF